MAARPRVSFLIPAHNEERVIALALDRLAELRKRVRSFEVLVGLDGCTDRTEEIVRSYRFPRVFVLNERRGKHVVINALRKKARGDVCVVHDADLRFAGGPADYRRMLSVFDRHPEVGAIADNYTVNYDIRDKRGLSLLYLGDLWNMYFLLEYKLKRFARPYRDGLLEVPREGDARHFFFVNFFRKKSVQDQHTLCDDGERLFHVLERGERAVILPLMQKPYLVTSIETTSVRDLLRQKYRGAIARAQIARLYGAPKGGFAGHMLPSLIYVVKNGYRTNGFKASLGTFFWWIVVLLGQLQLALNPPATGPADAVTREGWRLRIGR